MSLVNPTEAYTKHVDSLAGLKCNEDNLNLGVIIRKKGSVVKVNKRIAEGTAHNAEIQTLIRLKYDPCSKGIDTVTTDKVWK